MNDNVALIRYGSKAIEIELRYDRQDIRSRKHGFYRRRDLTPKQLKRIRKQRNKWRKRIFNQPSNFGGISHLMGVEDEA